VKNGYRLAAGTSTRSWAVDARSRQIALALLVSVFSSPSMAVVLDFEDLAGSGELAGAGTVYFSQGYSLSYAAAPGEPHPVGFFAVGASWSFNGRSTAFVANSCSATTTLVADDNNPLTLQSIDLAALNGDKDVTVTFVGTTVLGTTVAETVPIAGRKVWMTHRFHKDFKHLQKVRWTQGDCTANPPSMIDNVRVSPSWKAGKAD